MAYFPVPANENDRLAALHGCDILDTPPERLFDDIAQLASQLCGTPIALVSLIDRSRQWFKARVGLKLSETPRSSSLCAHAIVQHGPLVVRDTLADPRFVDHPLVTAAPHVRFYAAVPLVLDDGAALGTVCVMDRVPRELTATQLASLERLARRASSELNLRRQLAASRGSGWGAGTESDDATTTSSATTQRGAARSRRTLVDELPVACGAVVGERYRIEQPIGAGGMGVVARAVDMRRGVPVAIKFMRPSTLADPPSLKRFVREAQVLFALDSEHVARVHDFGRLPEGAPFIVMEYLEGTDLAGRVSREGRLSVHEAITVMLQACAAVQAAHDQGIFHRDLKPANLFLARDAHGSEHLKVLDFGISKLAASDQGELETALTGEATELGSPSYMAPEQMLGAADADTRSDVWSLGIVLYELLAGRPPFRGPNRIEICANVLAADAPPITEFRPDLPSCLVNVIERCLEKRPESRFQSVTELAAALERCRVAVARDT